MQPSVPVGDVLPEALFTASLLIKPARTCHKALQADRRRAQPSLWVDGLIQEIRDIFVCVDKTLCLAIQTEFQAYPIKSGINDGGSDGP